MNNPIAIARNLKSISATALAATIGVSPSQLSQWESGYRTPSREAAQRIASALDIDIAWIMGCPQNILIFDPIEKAHIEALLMRSEIISGYGTLYHVYVDAIGSAVAMIVSDDIVFTTADWQGTQPACAEEIGEYRWMDSSADDAIMLDGLPRAL